MKRWYRTAVMSIAMLSLLPVTAKAEERDSTETIIDHIQASGIITIVQPERMLERLSGGKPGSKHQVLNMGDNAAAPAVESSNTNENTEAVSGTARVAGYRVQVFSDNNARSAKSEARSKAQAINERMPQYRTYVVYQSPYWRLKVGDFTTATEAENVADMIKKMFPSYAREVRVVRDRINK